MRLYKLFEQHEQQIEEGPHDPHIFKAIFLAGGPGSGKSYIADKLLTGYGLKSINSDEIYEYLAQKHDMDLSDPAVVGSDTGQSVRDRAKALTSKRRGHYLDGRLGVIIDGTGKDLAKVKKDADALKSLGYEVAMLFVNTSEDVAQERNTMRPRQVPKAMVSKMWHQVQQNIMKFQQLFGNQNFHIIDNSGGLEDPDRKANFDVAEKQIRKFISAPPTSHIAKKWINQKRTK